jgi:hypothetical protein
MKEAGRKTASRRGRGLIAFMAENEAIAMMKGGPVQPGEDVQPYLDRYLEAREALEASSNRSIDPAVNDIESVHQNHLYQVSSTPIFQQSFQGLNWSFKTVEIDKIVCFQQWVDLDYVGELAKSLPATPDSSSVVKFCLPIGFPVQAGMNIDAQSSAITISSKTPHLAVGGLGVNQAAPGTAPSVVFTLGVNANYVQVVKYEGRHFIKNGYHRAYALRERGVSAVPCVYAEVSDYAMTGANRPGFFSRETIMSARPPTIPDFFDNTVSADIKIQPTMNVIRIKAEQYAVPIPPEDVEAEDRA